jgi:Ca2+-binding EF-hand superfamily protein
MHRIEAILTGRSKDAQRLFYQYDKDKDALLSYTELFQGLETWGLNLQADTFSQFVDCNLLYADRDMDGHLSLVEWTQLFKLVSEVWNGNLGIMLPESLSFGASLPICTSVSAAFLMRREQPCCLLQVGKKFIKCDEDKDGMINKTQFGNIIKELDLKLSPLMLKQYVDVNFKFVDRTLQGKISFGQFLACYANFLYSYEISQVSSGTAFGS